MADLTTLLSRFLTDLYAGGVLTSPFSLGPLTVATPTGASATSNYLNITRTIPTLSANFQAIRLHLTEPNGATNSIRFLNLTNVASTSPGSGTVLGVVSNALTDTSGEAFGGQFSAQSPSGNIGKRWGVMGRAEDGNWNIGVHGYAVDFPNLYSIGVAGNSEGLGTNNIGGLFQLGVDGDSVWTPPTVKAAVVANVVGLTDPIFLGLDDGVEVFRIGLTSVLSTIPSLGPNGTSAAPAFASSTTPSSGMYFPSAGAVSITTNFEKMRIDGTGIHVGAQTLFLGTSPTADDISLMRRGAGDLALNGSLSHTGTNGQVFSNVQQLTELTTIAAAATTDTTIQMPANSVVLGVSVRVTTVIPTAATFTVGDSGSAARFSTAAVSTAATSTDPGTKAGAYYNASALSVRITPNLTPAANTGRVRVTIYYYSVTPPTS